MTVHRWPLALVVATLPAVPACLSFERPLLRPDKPAETKETAGSPSPPMPPADSAFPTRPGEKVPTHPATTARRQPADADDPTHLVPISAPPQPLPTLVATAAEAPLLAATRAFVENRPVQAIEALRKLDKPQQDFVLAVLPILVRGAQLGPDGAGPDDVAAVVEQLRAAADRLEPLAALRVDRVAFCKNVAGFGRYEPVPEGLPFRVNGVGELYVEARHLASRPAAGPNGEKFVTRYVLVLEVRDAHDKVVPLPDPDAPGRRAEAVRYDKAFPSHAPVHDTFVKCGLTMPAAAGVYTVTAEVRDPVGGRAAKSAPVKFLVAGP